MNLKPARPRDDVIVVVMSSPAGMSMIVVPVTAAANMAAVIVIVMSPTTSETASAVGSVIVLMHIRAPQRTLELMCELIGFSERRADVPRFGVSFRDRLSQKLIHFSQGVLELSDILSHTMIVVEGLDIALDTPGKGRDDVRVLFCDVSAWKMKLDLISEMVRFDVQGMGQLARIRVSTPVFVLG